MSDCDLLRRFVEADDESAFAELVARHVHAVYSTAYRITRNAHLSQEVAQDAFCLLARRAGALPPSTLLVAWLHRTTWHLAMKALRGELRRQARDQLASTNPMNTADQESLWSQIAPLLDQAIESLNQTERQAVLLRFFERKPGSEIATALGVTEEAARMRVSRAVEKLRIFFAHRGIGISCSSAALMTLLTNRTVEAAPTASVHAIEAAVRLAGQSTPSLGLQLMTLMAQTKLKTSVVTGIALLLALITARQVQLKISGSATTDANPDAAARSTITQTPARSGNAMARFFSRIVRPGDLTQASEAEALDQLREILYSAESDIGLPPEGMAAAIGASGSKRRAALDLMLEALRSGNPRAAHRAAAGLQFFPESADELVPELMAVFKTSKDADLLSYIAMPLSAFKPGSEMIPMIIEAFKQNPAASDGVKNWTGMYLYRNKADHSDLIQYLSPLLESEKPNERLTAALLLAKTSAKDDPRLVATLIPSLRESNGQDGGGAHMQSIEALQALTQIGTAARSAADAIQEYGRKMPGMREPVLDALAATSPDLRTEIPELDAKLIARDEAAALAESAKKGELGISGLLGALENPEARMHSVEKIGALGQQAAEALPRLREILKSGGSDSRPDANNYLFAVATAIRQIDPTAPTYYRPEDLLPAFMDATRDLNAMGNATSVALGEEAEIRMFSPRPFDRNEIVTWMDKLKTADLQIRQSFVRTLQRSPSLSQLELGDQDLARAPTP